MNKQIKISFFDAKNYDIESFKKTNSDFNFDLQFIEAHLNSKNARFAQGADAVCAFVNDTIDRQVIDELHAYGIKLIALRSAGYNNVDLEAAYNRMHIVRVPAYSPHAVAEFALALMLSLNRKIHKAYFRTREHNFSINGFIGFDMKSKTVGIIGTGRIGMVMIKILKGFDMNILAYDSSPDTDAAKELGFTYVSLEQLYRNSDIITLHCPLVKDTFHMINHDSISIMKDNVMIINTSRGQLIDTKTLIDELKSGKIGAAGLDVYEEEGDYFFEDFSNQGLGDDTLARLLTFPNVIITSHQAFFTREAMANISHTTLNNIKLFFEKNELPNEICYRCQTGKCLKKETGRCF